MENLAGWQGWDLALWREAWSPWLFVDGKSVVPHLHCIQGCRGALKLTNKISRIKDDSVWTGQSVGSKEAFCFDLTPAHIRTLCTLVDNFKQRAERVESIEPGNIELGTMAADVSRWVAEVESGRGLIVVRGFPVDEYSVEDIEMMYWCLGLQFGLPVSQSVMGDRLGHVIDVTDVDPHARAYRNNRELTLHTDLGDVVSFLCVRKAKTGGVSWFSSALAVHNELHDTRIDLLERLYEGYPWFRSGENSDDSEPVTPWAVPVLSNKSGKVSCRYVRDYIIEAGAHPGGTALDNKGMEALDMFDDIAHREGVPIKFMLEPGEAVFINNLTVLHARTRFESYAGADNKRLLLRLWLRSHTPRPSISELQIFDGDNEHGIPPQVGKTPSYVGQTQPQSMPESAKR